MFCARCGAGVPAGHSHCGACGMPMAAPFETPPPYAVPPAHPGFASPYPYVQATPYAAFPAPRTVGNGFSTAAIVLAGVALLIVPIVVGPIAVVLAAVGTSRGESRAALAVILAIAGTLLGMVIGAIIGLGVL